MQEKTFPALFLACNFITQQNSFLIEQIGRHSVIAKYAGHAEHVRQTSADVRQRAQTLPDILSSMV